MVTCVSAVNIFGVSVFSKEAESIILAMYPATLRLRRASLVVIWMRCWFESLWFVLDPKPKDFWRNPKYLRLGGTLCARISTHEEGEGAQADSCDRASRRMVSPRPKLRTAKGA